jgi:hypothetical protein
MPTEITQHITVPLSQVQQGLLKRINHERSRILLAELHRDILLVLAFLLTVQIVPISYQKWYYPADKHDSMPDPGWAGPLFMLTLLELGILATLFFYLYSRFNKNIEMAESHMQQMNVRVRGRTNEELNDLMTNIPENLTANLYHDLNDCEAAADAHENQHNTIRPLLVSYSTILSAMVHGAPASSFMMGAAALMEAQEFYFEARQFWI